MPRARLTTALLALALAAAPALAQAPPAPDWTLSLGAFVAYVPDYEGSDDHELRALPAIDASWRDLVFLRGTTLGANLVSVTGPGPGDGLRLGPFIRYRFGRDEGDNAALRGLGDIDAAAELGGFAHYGAGPWSLDLSVAKDVAGGHEGVLADAGIGFGRPLGERLRASLRASATWADRTYMERHFGVSAAQSARSGLRTFAASGGVKDIGLSLTLIYAVSDRWSLAGRIAYTRLLGDAADAPIVADLGSADQIGGSLTLAYRF